MDTFFFIKFKNIFCLVLEKLLGESLLENFQNINEIFKNK